jgi:hypothetical protein
MTDASNWGWALSSATNELEGRQRCSVVRDVALAG